MYTQDDHNRKGHLKVHSNKSLCVDKGTETERERERAKKKNI